MVSYEVALGLLDHRRSDARGTLSLVNIVEAQRQSASGTYSCSRSVSFFSSSAVSRKPTGRRSICRKRSRSLVAGFHTEYSGFRFSLFFIAEYAAMIVVACHGGDVLLGRVAAAISERSRHSTSWITIPSVYVVLRRRSLFSFTCYLVVPRQWPRYRYDQLMKVGWQFLLPIAMANVIVTADSAAVWEEVDNMKVKRPELTLLKKIFLVDLIKGLLLTFSYQRPSKNYTEQYPKVRPKDRRALPRRAAFEQRSGYRRDTLHRLQPVRAGLSGALH